MADIVINMVEVPLSKEREKELLSGIPNLKVLNRLLEPNFQWHRQFLVDNETIEKLTLSRTRLLDAIRLLRNAQYALIQAVTFDGYYMQESESDRDSNHAKADFTRRFFAEYVPLLLYSSGEHASKGIADLFELDEENIKKYKSDPANNIKLTRWAFGEDIRIHGKRVPSEHLNKSISYILVC